MIRFFDIFFSGLALLVLAPLLLPIAVLLRFTGEGEIFFIQQRVGQGGRKFGLLKFATMLKESPNIGTGTVTTRNDPRVLPVGRLLRKTKINELPQLLNILRGDMSVVGPRPLSQRCFDVFDEADKVEIIRVRPGLSGLGAIFFRDEENLLERAVEHGLDRMEFYDRVISPYKGKLEAWYVHHRTIRNYFLVILVTIWVVLFPQSKIFPHAFPHLPTPPPELQ